MNANLYSLFERHFPDGAEQPFLAIPNGPVIHYDDLAAMSAQVAGALVAAGCRPGDRVAAQVDKHWHVVALYLGCLRAGLVYLPLNTGYQPREVAYFLRDAKPRIVVSRTRPPAVALEVRDALDGVLVEMGSAGAKVASVVQGLSDAYVHAGGQYEWDSAAPVAVARAAGLHTSRLDGAPLEYNRPDPKLPDLIVCRPELAEAVLKVTAGG